MKIAFPLALALALSTPAFARTPNPGSQERTAILDALRPSIEAELDPSIEFVVQKIESKKGWAFVQATPQRRGGQSIRWSNYYNRDEWQMMDGLTVTAVLRFANGRWNLVQRAIGATDAWYCGTLPPKFLNYC